MKQIRVDFHGEPSPARMSGIFRVLVVTSLAALCGCAALCPTHYVASAKVLVGSNGPGPGSTPLPVVVGNALQPLGFTMPDLGQVGSGNLVTYSAGGGFFHRNRVDVKVHMKEREIVVFDYRASRQDDFTRRVEQAMTEQIRSTYGAIVDFKPPPHPDHECFGP